MPFPWKKNRVPRISQIVADLQSPKRGGSLVVETGFPTSLIDLCFKNRSRFTKHRSRKPPQPSSPSLSAADPPPPPPPSPASSPPPPHLPAAPSEQHDTAAPDQALESYHGSGANVLVLVAKILMVLALVASVQRLTVGITASAFALLLLEYAGRRRVLLHESRWFRKVQKKECVERIGVESAAESRCEGLSIDEIEVEVCEIGRVRLIEDCSVNVLDRSFCDEEDVSECKIRRSRSGRFKSKMAKLVSKKFRGSKKEKNDKANTRHIEGESGSEVSVGEEKLPILEIEEKKEEKNGDNYKNKSIGNSGSSMVLVMIALVGLLLGRFTALGLMMTWCCLMKMGNTLWRSHNVPMIKCSVSNS